MFMGIQAFQVLYFLEDMNYSLRINAVSLLHISNDVQETQCSFLRKLKQ